MVYEFEGDDERPQAHEVAESILGNFHIKTFQDNKEIVIFGDGTYRPGGEGIISKTVEDELRQVQLDRFSTNHFCAEVLGHIKRRTSVRREEFDADPYILNLQNGLLDLRTFRVTNHRPDYLSLVQLPVRYERDADCPRIKRFIRQVTWQEDLPTIQEYVGACIWREPIQKVLLLNGEGANGKTTLINLVRALVGPENISARSLQELVFNRFAKADLFSKLTNLSPDLPDQPLKDAGLFKALTGGDPITAEKKFQQPFTFTPYAKHIYSCNKIPEVFDDTTAFFRRWIIVTFPNQFLGDKDNKNLLRELTTPEELSGFLNFAIEGLERLQKNNWTFSNSKSVEDVKIEYINKSSPVKGFVLNCCIEDPGAMVPKKNLYPAFVDYCNESKLPLVTSDTFHKRLPMYVRLEDARPEIEGKRVHVYIGLTLREDQSWVDGDAQRRLDDD